MVLDKLMLLKLKTLLYFSYEIEITSEVTGRAPTPQLSIGVKQSGKITVSTCDSLLTFY